MATHFDQLMQTPQAGKGKVVVGKSSKEKAEDNKTGITVTAAIFFDGTLNNRANTLERINQSAVFKENDADNSSYDNYYSNVAILEYLNAQKVSKNKQVSIYIEGEGTDDRQSDDSNGYAFGDGDTGIPGKVTNGIKKLAIRIRDEKVYNSQKERIDKLTLSVFGFSRGAAAARHFISRKAELCKALNISPAVVEFTFVGLFDTVSSYEHGASFATNVLTVVDFGNDVKELNLCLTDPAIKKVVHLVAGDEHRKNFASIASAIAAGTGYELVLPGVHSDIGGGYGEVEVEDRTGTWEEWTALIAGGWYQKKQVNLLMGQGSRTIPYHYQLVPLAIMAKLATRYGAVLTNQVPREVHLQLPADPNLVQARAELVGYALRQDGAHRKRVTLSRPLLDRIRNGYLHRSVSTATAMEANFEDGKPSRILIVG